jgi:hypothetical protein
METRIKLHGRADVVEYNLARKILWLAGYGVRREADHLMVYEQQETSSLYVRADTTQPLCMQLFVDEGRQSDVLYMDGSAHINSPWEELVDFTNVLSLLVNRYAPQAKVIGSPYMGRGMSGRFMQEQYMQILKGLDGNFTKHFYCECVSTEFQDRLTELRGTHAGA